MERIEDRSKALSYIGIEVADALKLIPTPEEPVVEEVKEEPVQEVSQIVTQPTVEQTAENQEYLEQTRVEVKPSLWQRIKNSKVVKAIKYIRLELLYKYQMLCQRVEEKNKIYD